ncbi:MAG: folate-binding protein [Dokdonella sp.]
MTPLAQRLCPAELLVLDGADAIAFAHAQFTSQVSALAIGSWQWSAWLDAQGRARHFFALLRMDATRLLAWLPLGNSADMHAALTRFVFRSKVTLDALPRWALHALQPSDLSESMSAQDFVAHEHGYALLQPGPTKRIAWLAPSDEHFVVVDALADWRLQDIAARLPLLTAESSGEFVPQALDLERFDAIRFDKGCYPGQEVAARLHFRGGNKRHLHRVTIAGAPPKSGTPIVANDDGRAIGQVLYSSALSAHACEAIVVIANANGDGANFTTSTGSSVLVINE